MIMDGSLTRFEPHPLLRSRHAQTLAGAFPRWKQSKYRAERHIVSLSDGDRLVLHDDRPSTWRDGGRSALLVHGLGGSHASGYVARIAEKLQAKAVRVFRMDMRGVGVRSSAARALRSIGSNNAWPS